MSEFGSINLDEVTNETARLNDKGQSFLEQFVPMPDVKPGQTGSVALRILPPARGAKLYQYTRIHQINGRKVHCPRPLVNGKWDKSAYCPVCEYYNSLWRKVDKLEEDGRKDEAAQLKAEARNLKPIERYYYNAIVRKLTKENGESETNAGPRILSIGKTIHQMIMRAIVGDESEPALGDVTDIKAGFDFIIRKELRVTGDEAYPNYDRSSFARESSPAGTPDEIKEWAQNLYDLTKLRVIKDVDVLEKELAIHRGLIPDESETFDVDEFDRKYRQDGEEVEDAPVQTTKQPTETATAPAVEESKVADEVAAEIGDLGIDEDDKFFEELNGMDDE